MEHLIHAPGDGEPIALGPNEVVIHVAAEDTDGAFSLCEYTAPPDGPSPPPHIHEESEELIYVLEGAIECELGDSTVQVEAGASVLIPAGTAHTFSSTGSQTARLLLVYSPGGFEGYFEEMGAFLETLPPGPPDQEKIQEKAAELNEVYDQAFPG